MPNVLLQGLLIGVLAATARALWAQTRPETSETHAELMLGTAWSLPAALIIRLGDSVPLSVRARYATRPLSDAPYYAVRVGGGRVGASRPAAPTGYEGELLHHKLYLSNPVPPVERFEISHGYNLAMASALRAADNLTIRVGLGLVVAHPEGRIAGHRVGGSRRTFLGGGYHIAGLALHVGVGRRYPLARGNTAPYAAAEVKLTAAVARVRVGDAGGSAVVPNVAVHGLAGVGVYRATQRDRE